MSKHTKLFVAFLFCSVLIYELPYFLTLRKTGWSPLPAVVDYPADQMLYLNLSVIKNATPKEVVNPWYGTTVPAVDVPHLRFPITFLLFRVTHTIFRSWTTAMLVWAGMWAGLTFVAGVFCLNSLFPEGDRRWTVIAAFGLMVLQSPLIYVAEFRQLPSSAGFYQLWLPYLRFAFPQVAVPTVLVYLGTQIRALKIGSKWALAVMVLLQFVAFTAYPYILPVVAMAAAIAFLIALRQPDARVLSTESVLLFAAVCGLLDVGYLLFVGFGSSQGNVQFALQFRREMILPALRPYVLVLVTGACLALFSRASVVAARVTVAGLALSSALFAFSDVFFPVTAIVLIHVNYFIALTTWLPWIVVLWPWIERFDGRLLRVVFVSLLLVTGTWEAFANYRTSLSVNSLHAAAVIEIEGLALKPKDLLLAPAQFSDDISCWVPLVSPAKVLFTRDAENVLSADIIRGEQALRQALYLEARGISHATLLSWTDAGAPDWRMNSIALFGEMGYLSSPLQSDHLKAKKLVRDRLGPMLAQLESDPTSANFLFRGYDRVIVIDGVSEPLFQPPAFAPWLEIEQAYQRNGMRIWVCRPKASS